jgi:hypothetical protein
MNVMNVMNALARRMLRAGGALAAVAVMAALAACGGRDSEGATAGSARGVAAGTAGVAGGPAGGTDPAAQPLRYDSEYPAVGYSTRPLSGRVARLEQALARGELTLERDERLGLLPALLDALDIDPASQVLVFSRTSFQVRNIAPETPRAIYFNDDTYVAKLHGSDMLEIASMDPALGPVFHTLGFEGPAPAPRGAASPPRLERQMERCLRCHDSLTMSGGGVPRLMIGSGYIGTRGQLVSHEGWILTTQRTPLRNRWGGWYVTGRHGEQVHLGNLIVRDVATLAADLEGLRTGNLDRLPEIVDAQAYITDSSDIVALMVLQHQTDAQNVLTRVAWDTRSALDDGTLTDGRLAEIVEPLVRTLLFAGEARLTDRISGGNDFAERFVARGPHDSQGRTLRELELTTRLLRYPLSWLIYSEAFDALPAEARAQFERRLAEVLGGEDQSEALAHFDAATRAAIAGILAETKPVLVAR